MKGPRYKIAIAGAVETQDCSLDTLESARKIGQVVGKKKHFLVTGGQHGFPHFSALGAKDVKGEVIYFSPAANLKEHKEAYRLDASIADLIIYTGFGHVGSGVFISRSADAVIIGCGKFDALHEFTLALKEGKPVGVLKGDWETDEVIERLVGDWHGSHLPIVFEDDPEKLVEKLIELIK